MGKSFLVAYPSTIHTQFKINRAESSNRYVFLTITILKNMGYPELIAFGLQPLLIFSLPNSYQLIRFCLFFMRMLECGYTEIPAFT